MTKVQAGALALLVTCGCGGSPDGIYLLEQRVLLDRYVTAAQRISTFAVGNPKASPGTAEYSISREFSQNVYIEGLPLGTRGGIVQRQRLHQLRLGWHDQCLRRDVHPDNRFQPVEAEARLE